MRSHRETHFASASMYFCGSVSRFPNKSTVPFLIKSYPDFKNKMAGLFQWDVISRCPQQRSAIVGVSEVRKEERKKGRRKRVFYCHC